MATNKEINLTPDEAKELSGVISHETNMMYLLARCIDILTYDIESRMRKVNATFCVKKEVKKRLKDYANAIHNCEVIFENFIEPKIHESVNGDWKEVENQRVFCNELLRLILLYYEKCSDSRDNHCQVFDLLDNFKDGIGIFTDADINRFDLGCR